MQTITNATSITFAERLEGPSDLYDVLLVLKNGFSDGRQLGCYSITKKQAKAASIPWTFVLDSVKLLGLQINNRSGINGHTITK